MSRLLSVSALALFVGGAVGVIAGEPQLPSDGEVYELPPFTTYGFTPGTNWRYAEIPGFEVLTQCSDDETREIVAALWRGRRLVLPPAMRPHFSLPMTVVLFDQQGSAGGGLQSFGSVRGAGELQSHWKNLIKRTLEDRESFALNLWPGSFEYSAAFRFDLFTLLRRRAPAAPAWLREGLFGGYGVHREGVYWYENTARKGVHVASWCSTDEAKDSIRWLRLAREARADGKRPQTTPALEQYLAVMPSLFERPPPAPDDPAYGRWAATAALFVRWGTYDCPPAQVAQFWHFAERACSEVVNETLFKECFGGRSYADVRAELSWYLPIALTTMGEASAGDLESMPKLRLQPATSAQIARVRGEWERMEAAALAPRFPDVAKNSREQAGRTLNQPKALSDPRVQASLGLLALDNGDLVEAQKHLELAVAGKVPGPRPYLELARLRWAAGRLDDSGALAPDKLGGVIDLLLAAEQQQPPLASVYLLLAEAVRFTVVPSPEQIAALHRGRHLFPNNPQVQAAIARSLAAK